MVDIDMVWRLIAYEMASIPSRLAILRAVESVAS